MTIASTAAFTPTGAGSVTVQLVVSDGTNTTAGTSTTTSTVLVAASAVTPVPPTTSGGGGGGGGGASWAWVSGVALAAATLQALRRSGLKASRRKA